MGGGRVTLAGWSWKQKSSHEAREPFLSRNKVSAGPSCCLRSLGSEGVLQIQASG